MGSDEVYNLSKHIDEHRLAGSQVINYDDETIQINVREDCSCGLNEACDHCGGKKEPPTLKDGE